MKYQSNLKKIYFILQITAYHEEKSGQELKKGTWRQKLKQKLWVSTAYWFAPLGFLGLIFFYILWSHLSTNVTAHMGWLFHINHQLRKCPAGQPNEGIFFSVEVLELTKQTKRKANNNRGPQITSPDACFYEHM